LNQLAHRRNRVRLLPFRQCLGIPCRVGQGRGGATLIRHSMLNVAAHEVPRERRPTNRLEGAFGARFRLRCLAGAGTREVKRLSEFCTLPPVFLTPFCVAALCSRSKVFCSVTEPPLTLKVLRQTHFPHFTKGTESGTEFLWSANSSHLKSCHKPCSEWLGGGLINV
jgi:hypothetical protein